MGLVSLMGLLGCEVAQGGCSWCRCLWFLLVSLLFFLFLVFLLFGLLFHLFSSSSTVSSSVSGFSSFFPPFMFPTSASAFTSSAAPLSFSIPALHPLIAPPSFSVFSVFSGSVFAFPVSVASLPPSSSLSDVIYPLDSVDTVDCFSSPTPCASSPVSPVADSDAQFSSSFQ